MSRQVRSIKAHLDVDELRERARVRPRQRLGLPSPRPAAAAIAVTVIEVQAGVRSPWHLERVSHYSLWPVWDRFAGPAPPDPAATAARPLAVLIQRTHPRLGGRQRHRQVRWHHRTPRTPPGRRQRLVGADGAGVLVRPPPWVIARPSGPQCVDPGKSERPPSDTRGSRPARGHLTPLDRTLAIAGAGQSPRSVRQPRHRPRIAAAHDRSRPPAPEDAARACQQGPRRAPRTQ